MRTRYTVVGDGKVGKRKADPAKARAALDGWARRTAARIAFYPPPSGTSNYVRTGDYGRGWRTKTAVQGGDLVAEVTNDVEYARFVGGDNEGHQRDRMAEIGWTNMVGAGDEEWPGTVAQINKALARD